MEYTLEQMQSKVVEFNFDQVKLTEWLEAEFLSGRLTKENVISLIEQSLDKIIEVFYQNGTS